MYESINELKHENTIIELEQVIVKLDRYLNFFTGIDDFETQFIRKSENTKKTLKKIIELLEKGEIDA